ncbi:hypothetical protein ACP70R_024279 [Stipagrostis hirtigluma subsp. patula]
MFDLWSAVQWWDKWQLRILVLGSLGIQWFLLVAAPMRKYTIRRCFRICIWLAYISSDALAIYALATLFNRHARATSSISCGGIASKTNILEVLWAPVLLIHLGGQEELTAYTIEDNELWTRHTVTLVSQVAVALYAFYKSWPTSSDWKLLTSAILLFVIGVISISEKPWALKKASINRLASVSATIQGTKKRTKLAVYLDDLLFSDWYNCSTKSEKSLPDVNWYNCFTESKKQQLGEDSVGLSEGDKVYMVLSDMSLSAAADDLVQRGRAKNVGDVLRPLSTKAEKELKRWLRGAFGLIYTRANVVFTRTYLAYHVLVVPILHIAALTLFLTSDKDGYNRTDVKITYILLCLTAALDVFALFIRQLLYQVMSAKGVPALCETVPGYNLVDAVLRRRQKDIGWLVRCATSVGCREEYFDCKGGGGDYTLYKKVSEMVLADLVDAQGRDLASYRVFKVPSASSELPVPHVEAGGPDLEIIQSSPGARSPTDKSLISTEHDRPLSEYEKFGGPAGWEEIPMSSCSWALSQKTTNDTEIQIMISSGAGSSFTTELSHPAAPPSSAARASDPNDTTLAPVAGRSDQQLPQHDATTRQHHTTEQQPERSNWALSEEQQKACGPKIRGSLRGSFDRSVLVWHIATDLCFRLQADEESDDDLQADEESDDEVKLLQLRMECTEAISNYMARLLNSHPDMLLTGSRRHLVSEAMDEFESILGLNMVDKCGKPPSKLDLNCIIEECSAWPTREGEGESSFSHIPVRKAGEEVRSFFHVPEACRLAKELLALDVSMRWRVIYRVWLGMLFYSASMCRGYLHAKSLGEGGEFLSYIWLVLSLKGARTLADKLQMPEGDDKEATTAPDTTSSPPRPRILDRPENRPNVETPHIDYGSSSRSRGPIPLLTCFRCWRETRNQHPDRCHH